ncbi:CBM35 domain-containing protein [Streptacidiphilus sp. N1-10]|uniref:CBM35 domain-containing protein n=1 Tax=Streptacidiphilus jeojiensis TaxID=3229225 RepID=A0ABV6XKC5_9ACTN
MPTPRDGRPHTTALLTAVSTLIALLMALVAWSAPTASAATTTYEAESAALSGGAVVGTDHTGYTGTGFVEGYTDTDKGTADTVFTVNAASAGTASVALRYANGTSATMTLSVYLNGTKVQQDQLTATADWNTWATHTDSLSLAAGSNTVAYKFDSTDSGNVNLDDIAVTPAGAPPAGQYEAESAALSGGAVVGTDHTGYTGTGFVEGYTDTDKGSADTVFTVNASGAGSTPITLRYANGTGSVMTLSVYVNGTKVQQDQLAATADWNTWGTHADSLTLKAGSNTVGYKFDSTDSGNVNLDNITVGSATSTPTPTPTPTPTSTSSTPPSGQAYEAETAFFTGGPAVATATAGYSGSGYLTGFTAQGSQAVVDVDTPSAGTYPVVLRYANSSGSAQTISLYLNGVRSGQLSLPAGSGWLTSTQNVALRTGLNLVGLQTGSGDSGNIALDDVTVTGGLPLAGTGATVPYTEYTATSSGVSTNGTVLPYSTTYPSLQAEATGRQAVQLTATGQYEQITLSKPADSIVLRYSIPANSDGSTATAPIALYANGSKVQDLTLTTQYSWLYGGGYYDTRSPSSGAAHHFYDETRALIGNWPAGTVLKLQKDAADTASSYTIDAVDTEQVDPALTMPAGYVSVTGYGVTPNSGADDTSAVNSALAALSGTGKGLWFPSGTYDISGQVSLDNVSVRGAGEWYTVIRSTAVNGSGGLFATGGTDQIADLTMDGDQTSRNNDSGAAGIEGNFGPGSLIFDVWVEHAKVGIWTDSANGLYVSGARVRDVFADGVHFNGGSDNSRVDQTVVRNTGDDELALDTEGGNVTGDVLAYNTVQSPIQANGIGVYGGGDNTVEDNTVADTVAFGSGVTISTAFGSGFTGPTYVLDNTLTRTGSYNSNWSSSLGGLWIYANQSDITQPVTVSGNTISRSTYEGVLLSYAHQISNLALTNDVINGAGTYGININDVTGSMTATGVTVSNTASGGLNNPGGYTITRGSGDSGF